MALTSFDNIKYVTATIVDSGEIISVSQFYFFRRLATDAAIHRALSRRELYVLGGEPAASYSPRARKTTWCVQLRSGGTRVFNEKREALMAALKHAVATQERVGIGSYVDTPLKLFCNHNVIEVTMHGDAAQFFGGESHERGARPKFLRGYGKNFVGRHICGSMRKRRLAR